MAQTDGVGTRKAGYADPHYGPFRCGGCVWLRPGSACAHPEVNKDTQVPKNDDGHAKIEVDGCCNYFRPKNLNISGLITKEMRKS